jgi:hypothetical protein
VRSSVQQKRRKAIGDCLIPYSLRTKCIRVIQIPRHQKEARLTPEEVERMKKLCKQIETEQDPDKFSQLVLELDELLARKNKRLDDSED